MKIKSSEREERVPKNTINKQIKVVNLPSNKLKWSRRNMIPFFTKKTSRNHNIVTALLFLSYRKVFTNLIIFKDILQFNLFRPKSTRPQTKKFWHKICNALDGGRTHNVSIAAQIKQLNMNEFLTDKRSYNIKTHHKKSTLSHRCKF